MLLVTKGQGRFYGFALCLYYNAGFEHVKQDCQLAALPSFIFMIIVPRNKFLIANGSDPSLGDGLSISL